MNVQRPRDPSGRLAEHYSATAAGYARHWAPVLAPMARALLPDLPLARASHILEVGCGTGGLLRDLAAAAPRARIAGADRALGMLRVAKLDAGAPLAVMDALRLALRAETFDVAVLAFVLFHLPDPAASLREVLRCLRPGGAIGLVVWGGNQQTPGSSIWTEELDAAGAGPDPRDPAVLQHAAMDTEEKLAELMSRAGFTSPAIRTRRYEQRWAAADLIQMQVACGLASRRLSTLAPERQSACRARAEERIARLAPDELVDRSTVLYGVGFRPE